MKKKIILIMLFAVALFITVSCSKNQYKTYEKEVSLISLNGYTENNDEATDLKDITYDGKLKLKFIEGEDYIPYIDVESYYTFMPDHISKVCNYFDNDDEVGYLFEVNGKKVSIRIFTQKEQVVFENQLSYVFEENGSNSSSLRVKYEYNFDTSKMKDHVIDYKEY